MTEQSQEDSAIDTSTATPIEEANTTDPVISEMKNLLGLKEEPIASRNQETKSEETEEAQTNSEENTSEATEDSELIDLLDNEELSETKTEDLIDIDGEKIPLETLKQERLRQKDYTQKTQKLAEEKREFDSLKTQLESESVEAKRQRTDLETKLVQVSEFLKQAKQKYSPQDLEKLYVEDPAEFVKVQADLKRADEIEANVKLEQQKILAQKKAESEIVYQKYIVKERNILADKLPIYADEKKGEQFRKDLSEFALSKGFSQNDIENLVDHRSVLILADAFKYNKLKQANLKNKKVSPKSTTLSSSRISSTNESNRTQKYRNNLSNLKKTGSTQDAHAVLTELFK